MTAATVGATTAAKSDRTARFGPPQREVRSALELFALCGIAFAQPTFDLLGKNTGIFATRGSTAFDLIVVSLAILFVPAIVLYAIEVLVGLAAPRARRYAHALACGIPFGIFVEEILKRTTDLAPQRLVHLGVLSGLGGALAIFHLDWMRMWLRALAIAPALFAALFLFASPASSVVFGGKVQEASDVSAKNPKRIVMVTFDELPTQSLLDGSGRVDAELFPNFAKLATESTWYRNDTTVAPYTERAMPAILTGRLPPTGVVVPSSDDYPRNLFTLLGGVYPLNVHEAVTSLCPKSFCAARATDATGIERMKLLGDDAVALWRDFASPKSSTVDFGNASVVQYGLPQMRQFVASLQPATKPQLDFVHIELPHQPWHLLPTLQDNEHLAPQQAASKLVWQPDQWQVEVARRQHLLQAQAADTVLGKIVDRLKAVGAWDESLVVVTADHGVSFTPGEGVRSVTKNNYEEILWTPLFFKYPNQKSGVVDDRPAQSIDVLPTIADVIGVKVPWKIHGTSLRGPVRPDFPRQFDQTKGSSFSPPDALGPKRGDRYLLLDPAGFQNVIRQQAVPAATGDPGLRVYRIGPYGPLLGQNVSDFAAAPTSSPSQVYLGGPLVEQFRGGPAPEYDMLDPKADKVPWAYLQGILDNIGEGTWIAIALNGRIVGLGEGLPLGGTASGTLTAILAPQLVTAGPNEVTLYGIGGDPTAPTLRPIPVFRDPAA